MNPYIAFSMEQRKKMVKADPSRHSNIGGLAKEIGAMWRELSDAEKAKYGSGTRKVKKVEKVAKVAKVEKTEKKKTSKAKGGRRQANPWLSFLKENFAKIKKENPSMALPDITKKIGQMYAAQK
jgi:ATP adenylyltransferase/5',5'''-P-1,P-4-tetraphosphate phosphorylase II